MEQQVTRLVYGSGGRVLAHRYSRWIMRRPMNFIITFAVPLIGGVIAFVVGTFRNTIAIPAAIGSCCFGLALLNLLILLLAKEF
jgi:hypothetical protein